MNTFTRNISSPGKDSTPAWISSLQYLCRQNPDPFFIFLLFLSQACCHRRLFARMCCRCFQLVLGIEDRLDFRSCPLGFHLWFLDPQVPLQNDWHCTGTVFGPKENTVCQAAATPPPGGLSNGFVTAIPAMYRMGLMGDSTPKDDVVSLLLWTASTAFFGMFFAVPLRSHFVINQDLVFPTPRAAAETIKSLHKAGSAAARDARDFGRAMIISFVTAMVWAITGFFIPGLFGSIHFLYYIGKAAGYQAMMNADAAWGWFFTWDFSFFGAGLMTPGNTVFSFCLGELIAFGIAGPLMTEAGYLTGRTGFPKPPLVGSAQSWFLWPGVAVMVFTAFSELGAQGPALAHAVMGGVLAARNSIRKLQKKEAIANTST